jgi:hypothetical protein
MTSWKKADCCTTVEIPMSETPKKIEFIMMKHSAAELVKARRVALMVSAENLRGYIW